MNDGGPAYPVHHATDACLGHSGIGFPAKDMLGNQVWVNSGAPGMSLRDWFAGMALAGHSQHWMTSCRNTALNGQPMREHADHVAYDAFVVADAMLTEREKQRVETEGP